MSELEQVILFEDFETGEKYTYNQFKIRNDREVIRFLKQFIILEETPTTNYKHKLGKYNKKGHWINGKKVNQQVYNYIKNWLKEY